MSPILIMVNKEVHQKYSGIFQNDSKTMYVKIYCNFSVENINFELRYQAGKQNLKTYKPS